MRDCWIYRSALHFGRTNGQSYMGIFSRKDSRLYSRLSLLESLHPTFKSAGTRKAKRGETISTGAPERIKNL